MTPHGPIYCETGHPWLFMAEPLNTVTNIFILLAAVLAWRAMRRARIGTPPDLAALIFLLFVTSIGSFFWHAFRTRLALDFDAVPGLLFLILFAALWMRALFGTAIGVAGMLGMIAATILGVWGWARLAPPHMPSALLFAPGFIVIAATGLGMAFATARKFGVRAARLGLMVMACAIPAAVFRSIDLLVCAEIPFGTHFLWHILLSAAAYLGIVLLLRMRAARTA
jgi:hypothetical protein